MAHDASTQTKSARKSALPAWAKAGASPVTQDEKAAQDYRVSRQMAGLLAGAALLLAVLAFGFGWQFSKKMTTRQLDAKYKAEIDRIAKTIMLVQGGAAPAVAPSQAGVGKPAVVAAPMVPVAHAPATGDPRQAGLNYLRLCQVPVAEGEKYANFLATEGQKTWREPLAHKAGMPPMVTVYAVNRGFKGGDRVDIEKARATLLALGDKWGKKNRGGNPFRSLMLKKHEP